MGKVGTMLESITENQEGNSGVFFCVCLFIGTLTDSQAFAMLLVVKSRAPWMCVPCCGEGDEEVLQGTVGSRQPHSAFGSPWGRLGPVQEVGAYCARDQCQQGGRTQKTGEARACPAEARVQEAPPTHRGPGAVTPRPH